MLSLKNRFHGHNSLRPVYQKGKSVYSRNMKVLWSPARSNYRVAVVVSKKVHRSAVVRNRIRRRLYALVKEFYADSHANADLVFLVQNPVVAGMPAEDLQQEVRVLLKKIA